MRTHVVVPEAELAQRQDELISASDFRGFELAFQGSEETLDASVLPWAADFGGPVAHTEQEQSEPKTESGEDPFVVGAYEPWPPVMAEGSHENR